MDGLIGIIDDSELSLDILAEFLESAGYTVETTSDETNAVAWAEKLRPDLLLVDLTLSRGSGEALVQELKKRAQLPSPIVIYSAHELTYVAEAAARCGADGFALKDDETQLLSQVRRWMTP